MKSFKMKQMEKVRSTVLKNITEIEKKRRRSEFAIVESLYKNQEINSEDVRYFNSYTAEITTLREELQQLEQSISELQAQEKKKKFLKKESNQSA